MSTVDLDRLPLLLRRHQVMQICGLNEPGYYALCQSNPNIVVRIGKKESRISKPRLFQLIKVGPHTSTH